MWWSWSIFLFFAWRITVFHWSDKYAKNIFLGWKLLETWSLQIIQIRVLWSLKCLKCFTCNESRSKLSRLHSTLVDYLLGWMSLYTMKAGFWREMRCILTSPVFMLKKRWTTSCEQNKIVLDLAYIHKIKFSNWRVFKLNGHVQKQ